jgi:hypothetical protein
MRIDERDQGDHISFLLAALNHDLGSAMKFRDLRFGVPDAKSRIAHARNENNIFIMLAALLR